SMGHTADVAAVTLGASVIEKHFCLSREMESVDSAFSMEPAEFAAMVEAVGDAASALGSPSFGPSGDEKDSTVFRRSIFACKDIAKGEVFTKDNIRIVRPGYGAKPKHYNDVLGAVADRA